MEHQGASSTGTYYRTFEVSCIYSGNTRKYSVTFEPNGKTIEQYRSKFMREECDCLNCSQKRKDREKIIKALKRDRAYKELSLLGE
ncbi:MULTISPECIES: hypothetical protein [Eubacterium]|mgnify:FL=1|jgi:hypothetical protein|uniref:hypothetical protein n=1 Tax=Eubacterium TaxID=1730 RepID=UPI000E50D96B|nr:MULTISPECIES: hypothetical protein [Eubacterium]MBS5620915.1 hypothetical protein [Eubacterium sp.]RHP23605.1 hypothetical protein DWZ69_01485 [Eubacterium sp. AF34-35BH]